MAAVPRAAGVSPRYSYGKRALLAVWAGAFALTLAIAWKHLGPAPWLGFWDMDFGRAGPYVLTAFDPQPGGAAARAGIHPGDRFDLREQTLTVRQGMISQPNAGVPIPLIARRGSRTVLLRFAGSTAWEGAAQPKAGNQVIVLLTSLWFLACALLIFIRRANARDGRALGLILVLLASGATVSNDVRTLFPPNPFVRIATDEAQIICYLIASVLLVTLASRYGRRYAVRSLLECCTYAIIAAAFLAGLAFQYSLLTLKIDPLNFLYSSFWNGFYFAYDVAVAAVALAAVACTTSSERPRVAWLLIPLPFALVLNDILATAFIFVTFWFANISVAIASNLVMLSAAMLVTYALLKRRVLDFEFLLTRTLVFAIISLLVVAAFVLLEWLLGSAMAGASHSTGLVANGALALALGLSMNYIHKRVDAFVDAVFFRKRYENERALREFSKEAAFVTESDALLDQTIAKLRDHTDARAAAVLIHKQRSYDSAREFGESPAEVGENDAAILALKTWHKPLDPHHYDTKLHGALALPMVSRGRLLGVVVCGERAGGEAYAPDEVEALADFAHGVGSAFDRLSDGALHDGRHELLRAIEELRQSNAAVLRAISSIEQRRPS